MKLCNLVKYNNATMNETHSRLFFHNQMWAKSSPRIRRVRIHHVFETDKAKACILSWSILTLTWSIPLPPPAGTFGSLTGVASLSTTSFEDSQTPVLVTSAAELESYGQSPKSRLSLCF